MAEIIKNLTENVEPSFDERALNIWRAFLLKTYPESENNLSGWWQNILNNTMTDERNKAYISHIEEHGGRHLKGAGYQACLRLRDLRDMGFLLRPVINSQAEEA